MTANPLKLPSAWNAEQVVAPSDPRERVTFWLEHGNQRLRELGKHHLRWCHANGNYFIEPRD